MLYATTPQYYSIQSLLNKMLNDIQILSTMGLDSASSAAAMHQAMPTASVRMAMAVLVAGPVIFFFPFFQRYFSRGIVVGAVKG
jgi:putative aldouronate transport system permease protein